jgi:hypothetical protein
LKLVPGGSAFISPDFRFCHRSSRLTHPAGSLVSRTRSLVFLCLVCVAAGEVHHARFLFVENFWALLGSRFSWQCIPRVYAARSFPISLARSGSDFSFRCHSRNGCRPALFSVDPNIVKLCLHQGLVFSLEFFDFGFDLATVCRGVSFPIC